MSAEPAIDRGVYELSRDPARMQIDVIHGYLRTTYWSPGVRRQVVERAIAGSIVVGAFERRSGAQVGFARAVTDRATFAWLCDVFVLPEHNRRGLARAMVRELMADPDLQTLRRWSLATKDAHGVYAHLGFTPVQPDRWMELKLPPEAWQDNAPDA
jgi:GNAT superfamily N-acetyltransferase